MDFTYHREEGGEAAQGLGGLRSWAGLLGSRAGLETQGGPLLPR